MLALIEATRVRLERGGASLRIRASGQPLRLLRVTGMARLQDGRDSEPVRAASTRFEARLA